MKILNIVGTRPNLIKVAAIEKEMAKFPEIDHKIVHTGQHYDTEMSKLFFDDLNIPEPAINLGVGSLSDSQQVAEIIKRFEPILIAEKPDAVLVVGDVNSTVACGLTAVKTGTKLIHVEAGLRSFDRAMPEEINRLLVDQISDLLFVTEPSGLENLSREGISQDRIHFVGNVMIDTLNEHLKKAEKSEVLNKLQLRDNYILVTLHRPSNVDSPETLKGILTALQELSNQTTVLFPVHPRTQQRIREFELDPLTCGLQIIAPQGYLDFLKLMKEASLVLTDSGGIQEETTILGIPCLTFRDNTERPITLGQGTNQLIGSDPSAITKNVQQILNRSKEKSTQAPDLWDGKAAKRIITILLEKFSPASPQKQI